MREALLEGSPVQFMSSGRSLDPLVFSGDTWVFNPTLPGCNSSIKAGDIVFCHVQPNSRYYCHLLWRVYSHETDNGIQKTCFIIGNSKEGTKKKGYNGWCYREHVYGILVKTQMGDYEPSGIGKQC